MSNPDSIQPDDPYNPYLEEKNKWYAEEVSLSYFLNFVASRIKIAKAGKIVTNIDSKVYYKLRHNLLKTVVLSGLDFESYKELPFKDFPQLQIDSERTPDFMQPMGDNFLMIEFTFCNKYETVLRTKNVFSKYDDEKSRSVVPIDDYYIFMSLDKGFEDTINTTLAIASKYSLTISETFKDEIEDVYNTVCSVTAYLNDFLPDLLSMNHDIVDVNIRVNDILSVDEAFKPFENLVGRKAVRSHRIRSLLKRFTRRLTMSLRRKPDWGRYIVSVNFVTNNCYISERENAASRETLLNLLDLSSQRLLDFCEVIGDIYLEKDLFADRDVELDKSEKSRPQDKVLVVDFSAYESLFYNNLFKTTDMTTVSDSILEIDSHKVSAFYTAALAEKIKSSKTEPYRSSPFIFHPCDTLKKGAFKVEIETGKFLTDFIIKRAFSKDVTQKRIIDRDINYENMDKLNTLISKTGMSLRKKYKQDYQKYSRLSQKNFDVLLKMDPTLSDFNEFRSLRSSYRNNITESTRIMYQNRVRLNLERDSRWDLEMEHFRKPKNVHRIVETLDTENTKLKYQNLLMELFDVTNVSTTDDILSKTEPIGQSLAENCKAMYEDLFSVEMPYRHTRMAHSTLFISQWCYSLMFYSNIKLNKDDFIYDNLGYSDTLLIVKGGKKIRSNKTSRLFRLLFPITLIQSHVIDSNSNTIFTYSGKLYCLTPWSMLRSSYLKKGFELYHNFGNFYITNKLEYSLSDNQYMRFISTKVLLLFSQKRKLEVWFSSLRYIYFNSLGTHTDILTLIKDMPILPYDSLIYLLQDSFITNYRNIYLSVKDKKLFDLVWLDTCDNFSLMVERFEENLFMTKAPFNPYSEHLKNMKSLIDTHRYFLEKVKSVEPLKVLENTDKSNSENYFNSLEDCDFNFDSKMSYIVGDFAGSYISSTLNKVEMSEMFNEIVSRNYTDISTSKGMREDSTSNFWGSKGHDVVFSKMNIKMHKILDNFPETPAEYQKLIRSTEVSFKDQIEKLDNIQLLFDMKDKTQYKGSREIYVMSESTKLLQNPLEKFFGKLCGQFPNELIHKPSSIRPKFIHSKLFEHKPDTGELMYCTMDCRKWAPRSNLWKYYFFIQGMAKFLPESFTNYFFNFWTLMFKKRVRFQKHFVDKLLTNEGYSDILNILEKSSEDTYDLVMPYSFMMGIFNYLSSLMHAASQVYFAERISSRINVDCNFIAHSDDSAAIFSASTYNKCVDAFSIYEKFQRSLNHLMSRKKCSLSKRSFEMISIMYCDRQFIPMTHKFLTNLAFDPKGAGWYDDVASITGKIVDLYNNGGTYLQCYSMQLTLCELLRKSYHLPRSDLLSIVPLALGGVPNYHPVHMILVGTRSHECILDLIEDSNTRSKRIKSYITMAGDYNPTIANRPNYVFPYYRYHEDTPILSEVLKDRLSAVSTLPERSTMISYFKHVNKLFDRRYVYSLTNIDTEQIMLSTLFYPCSIALPENKSIKLRDSVESYITIYKKQSDTVLEYTYPTGNYMSYFRQVENLRIDYKKVNLAREKTCKPMLYSTLENFSLRVSQENMMYLSAIEKWPDIIKIFRESKKFESLKEYMLMSLPGSREEKLNFIKNFDPSEKEDKMRSGYLFIPSQVKIDTPSRFFTYSLLYTTRRSFISTQKPQLFTPSEFTLESRGFEHLKHKYLLFKLIKKNIEHTSKIKAILNTMDNCNTCKDNTSSLNDATIYQNMFDQPEFKDFKPTIPFCDYTSTQIRGKNVWYSSSDFKLYSITGTIESQSRDGFTYTIWTVTDPDNLQQLWDLYRIFCISRGIQYERPTYQDTGLKYPKLAFTDFDTPYQPSIFSKGIVLPHSSIINTSHTMPDIHRKDNKFFLNDRSVDFEIYSIYDISQKMYNNHNLSSIKELIYTLDVEVNREELLKNFDNSKIYKVLLTDEIHYSSNSEKYVHNGLLGAPGSFTRALAIADEKKITRYRSSYSPGFLSKGAIEFDTVEGVPILDMYGKINYSRMRAYEKISLEKALSGYALTAVDKQNLVAIKNKMGLEALGNAVVLHKHIFRNMLAGSVSKIKPEPLMQLLITTLRTIHSCMDSNPRRSLKEEYKGSPKSYWSTLRTMLPLKYTFQDLALLITRGLLRSKTDNSYKFWSEISSDVLLSSMIINNKNFLNIVSMFTGILSVLKKPGVKKCFIDEDGNERYRRLKLARELDIDDDRDYDLVTNQVIAFGDPIILDEDSLDVVAGGDDLSDDEMEEREYSEDEDSYRSICYTSNHIKAAMQDTALNDYSSIEILSPNRHLVFPWLGKGTFDTAIVDDILYYRSQFPGKDKIDIFDLEKAASVTTVEFTDIAKPSKNKAEQDKLDLENLEGKIEKNKIAIDKFEKSIQDYRSKIQILDAKLYEEETKEEDFKKLSKEKDINLAAMDKVALQRDELKQNNRDLTQQLDRRKVLIKVEKNRLLPNVLKGREEAIESLKQLNVFNERLIDGIFPKDKVQFTEIIADLVANYQTTMLDKNLQEVITKRVYGRHNLPGFQGLLDDQKMLAELKSIFGDNCHLLLQGTVRLTKATYNQYYKFIHRNYIKANIEDKPMLIFIMSLLLDTVVYDTSDSWFTDAVNGIFDNIDNKINPEETSVIMPVNPRSNPISYRILDLFD